MISVIYNITKQENQVFVDAIVEDMILVYPQTKTDPEEYGPALCSASFELDEGEEIPTDEDELIDYLTDLNLEWKVIPRDEL